MDKGLYLHIPFCRSRCPYCDFYSMRCSDGLVQRYISALLCRTESLAAECGTGFDTVYIGGGTPSVLGSEQLCRIVGTLKERLDIAPDAEITVECNPFDAEKEDFRFDALAKAGINRISMGMQSADDSERRALGRLSDSAQVGKAVTRALAAGIGNISLDLMLGIPHQTADSLKRSIEFCAESGAVHVSAYLLKIEAGTRFFEMKAALPLPDEDETCDLYMTACEELEAAGFAQYEISNFAYKGFESRHNMKYWNCEEYLGIGPSAHSFCGGKRFFYERDIEGFINGNKPTNDGAGGSFEEYSMLRLRLSDGLIFDDIKRRFGFEVPQKMIDRASQLSKHGLVNVDSEHISLTRAGFLVSNAVIAELI